MYVWWLIFDSSITKYSNKPYYTDIFSYIEIYFHIKNGQDEVPKRHQSVVLWNDNFIHLTELSMSNFEVVKLVSEYFASKI